jgi:hypothetical protein
MGFIRAYYSKKNMRKLIIVIFLLRFLTGFTAFAQTTDSVIIQNAYGTEDKEVRDLIYFLNIDIYKLKIIFPSTANRKVILSYIEYKKGKINRQAKIFDDKNAPALYFTPKLNDSTFSFKVFSQLKNPDSVDIMVMYPGITKTLSFKTEKRNDYSMRDAILSNGKRQTQVGLNQKFPLLVYSLPYEDPAKPGRKDYCGLSKEGVPPEMWWDKYKVPHYIVFYIEFLE